MVPWNTVRAQYAKHNPPSHEKKAVDLRVEQLYEDSGFHSPPATETTVHKKGCDTLLRNILLWSEPRNRWVIYLSPFFFHLWLWIIKDSFWGKYEINFAASKHSVNEHQRPVSYPGGGSRKQKGFLRNGAINTYYAILPHDTSCSAGRLDSNLITEVQSCCRQWRKWKGIF